VFQQRRGVRGGNGKCIIILGLVSGGKQAMKLFAPFAGKSPCVALIVVLSIWFCADASSQSIIPSIPPDREVSEALIDVAIESVQNEAGLDDDVRARTIETLRDAKVQVRNRLLAKEAAAAFARALEQAPDQTRALRAESERSGAQLPNPEELGVSDMTSLVELERVLAAALLELSNAEAAVGSLDTQISTQESRPAIARQRIDVLRASRAELVEDAMLAAPPGESLLLTEARSLATELRRAAQDEEINRLEREILSHGVRMTLLKARRDVAERELVEQRRRFDAIQNVVSARRQAVLNLAQQAGAQVELAAVGKHPVVRALAERNAELSRELPEVAARIEPVTVELGRVLAKSRQIEQGLARSRQRLALGGGEAAGRALIEERDALPALSGYREQVRERRKTLATIGLAQMRIEEQRYDLLSFDERVDAEVAKVAASPPAGVDLDAISAEIRLLLDKRRELLIQAADTYGSYLRVLNDLDAAQERLSEIVGKYLAFLDENMIWVASESVVGPATLRDIGPAVRWAMSPRSWASTLAAFFDYLREQPVFAVSGVLGLILLLLASGKLQRSYRSLNQKVGHLNTDSIGLTIRSLAVVAVRAAPLPMTLAALGWVLAKASPTVDFVSSVSYALLAVAPFLYNLLLFRVFCTQDGVAQVHFGWRESTLSVFRRQLDRFAAVGVPLVFVTVLALVGAEAAYRESLGRFAFVTLMVVLIVSVYPLTSAGSASDRSQTGRGSPGWTTGLRRVSFALGIGIPLLLALLALLGYLYTAAFLTGLLINTFWLVLAIITVNLVVRRWIVLARRKLEWQMALEKRAARKAEQKDPAAAGDAEVPVVEDQPLDLDAIDYQTRQFLNAALAFIGVIGAWGIWSDLLPALGVLENVSLWSQTITVGDATTIVPVTLADLLLALLVIAVTTVASRNLPGLMEFVFLRHLTLAPGSRYAINTLLRYVIVTTGVITVLSIIGWKWSQVQWMVAALSVGLGFGLQEIVANFVSGLVILFERPVRVGDTITVGNLTGTVSRVRIRATTIVDWDRKEIIVPNKSFVTEQVVNWTLSDPITRLVLPVGIGYGSDVQLAHRVMESTLKSLPLVLDDPQPRVFFVGFGDSALNFNLYVYSRQLADRLPLTHAVYEHIFGALRENGIEIPFPQRDVHLRSSSVERLSGETEPSGTAPDGG
jgi:potassium efflux system protein